MGRSAGCAVLSQSLGGAGVRVGQHHGLSHCSTGPSRLRPGPPQPTAGQTLRAEGEEAAGQGWVKITCLKISMMFADMLFYLQI